MALSRRRTKENDFSFKGVMRESETQKVQAYGVEMASKWSWSLCEMGAQSAQRHSCTATFPLAASSNLFSTFSTVVFSPLTTRMCWTCGMLSNVIPVMANPLVERSLSVSLARSILNLAIQVLEFEDFEEITVWRCLLGAYLFLSNPLGLVRSNKKHVS